MTRRLIASSIAIAAVAGGGIATAATLKTSAALRADPHGMLRFNKRQLTVKHGNVTLHMTDPSTSGLHHGIAIQGNGVKKIGHVVAPGRTSNLTVRLKPGRYTFFCPVPGHRAAGMRGTLIVK